MNDAAIVERFRLARRDPGSVVLEGFHALKHASRFGAGITLVVTRDPAAAAELARELAPDAGPALAGARPVGAETFALLARRPHPTGVIAIARRPEAPALEDVLAPAETAARARPVVVLEEPRRPENVGAVVRVAAAAGAAAVITLGGVDPWGPAAVRGAAGLQFALPVTRVTAEDFLAHAGSRPLVAIDPAGEAWARASVPPGALLLFGTERRGLSPSLLARASRRVGVPMREGVSSLNLATAVAAVLYSGGLSSR